jgi:hypothetical protein
MSPEWAHTQAAALKAIAPVLDSLEAEVNRHGPIDLMTAYMVALGALEVVDMDKPMLERFVAVLIADRTHHAITGPS